MNKINITMYNVYIMVDMKQNSLKNIIIIYYKYTYTLPTTSKMFVFYFPTFKKKRLENFF